MIDARQSVAQGQNKWLQKPTIARMGFYPTFAALKA